ncbi:twin-arginine translocase TatA/TatE family subunit [Flavobacteriaceae bacterium]|nr:twin-arginine translocase TatA/TatE family subunit [Flavobacteriaceae bacterium]MDB9712804.1 twin-arginine translocase TatA/TatE family subunit [Flavobacteriaceae bacterium]MDC1492514.1 twin-arginine translocase TatA/TatE family subunit [Flavobacteriaceae bacterium]MDC1534806.1 twin-arginine translocase TatA/TatE family subunit [Flavobacteriaceae bacterium]
MLLYFFNLFISGAEIFIVLCFAVIFFGADKIPGFARSLGKGLNEIKHATNDIKKEIRSSSESIEKSSITKDVDNELSKVKKDLEEFSGSIKRNL